MGPSVTCQASGNATALVLTGRYDASTRRLALYLKPVVSNAQYVRYSAVIGLESNTGYTWGPAGGTSSLHWLDKDSPAISQEIAGIPGCWDFTGPETFCNDCNCSGNSGIHPYRVKYKITN